MEPWKFVLVYSIGLLALMYFAVILPGKRKNKKTQQMHDSVKVGDTISTAGGIIGTVMERDGDTVLVQIDEKTGTTMRIVIYAVQSIVEQADA